MNAKVDNRDKHIVKNPRKQPVRAEIYAISSCHDLQTCKEISESRCSSIPEAHGKPGGVFTVAFMTVVTKALEHSISYGELLLQIQNFTDKYGFSQIPRVTSSRPFERTTPFSIKNTSNDSTGGTRRALLIGICYHGTDRALQGAHNDVERVKKYLTEVHRFLDDEDKMTILMDDGKHKVPNRSNILEAFTNIAEASKPGDTVFIYYSGHGGQVKDEDGDEDDGFDETIIPADIETSEAITDDTIYEIFVQKLSHGVVVTCLMDCCHSGTGTYIGK